MGRLAYSQAKALWHQDRIAALRDGRPCAPVHVQLILSDLCNHDCSFCAYRMSGGLSTELFADGDAKNPNRRIPTQKAREIVRDCARIGVRAVQFTGGGEPTVHPGIYEVAGLAQELGMETGLVTNGVRLDVSNPATLGMQWIRVSVDAGTEETYCRIRRVTPRHWRTAWENLARLAETFDGALGVGYVVTPDNYREIAACAALCAGAGVRSLRVGAVFSEHGAGFYRGIEADIYEAIDDARGVPGVEVIGMFDRRLDDLRNGAPRDAACWYQHLTLYIGGDLGLYRCCNTAYTRAGQVGSLRDARLVDVWETLPYEPFDARGCRFCQFMGQNAAIASAVVEPEHSGFV